LAKFEFGISNDNAAFLSLHAAELIDGSAQGLELAGKVAAKTDVQVGNTDIFIMTAFGLGGRTKKGRDQLVTFTQGRRQLLAR